MKTAEELYDAREKSFRNSASPPLEETPPQPPRGGPPNEQGRLLMQPLRLNVQNSLVPVRRSPIGLFNVHESEFPLRMVDCSGIHV